VSRDRARAVVVTGLAACCGLLAAAPAQAATSCSEPGAAWKRATPAQAGMNAAKLQDAMDYGTSQLGFAVRVYRRGCLVAEDRLAPASRNVQFESWSMAKSVTSVIFGRAMQLKLISPDDTVGSLVPEADRYHGAIKIRDLLTMTSGLRWNGLRDYNIFTNPDRTRDALTLPFAHRPGTFFEYAQSPVSLLSDAIGRSAGQDTQTFAQRELMGPLGIKTGSWRWTRDPKGHVGGFYGVNMRADDFGRLGELMRRGGSWRGKRLLAGTYMRRSITPTKTNGCYGWLIWLNADSPCVGPTITKRPVDPDREFPDLPANVYRFSGLFGQLVTVFPSQDLVVVRTGQDSSLVFSGGTDWEHELYRKVLGSITDQKISMPGPTPNGGPQDKPNADYGFQTALQEPGQYKQGLVQDPLPPAGPGRARAALLDGVVLRATRSGRVSVRLRCPARWSPKIKPVCAGVGRLEGGRHAARYRVGAGKTKLLRFRLTARRLRKLNRSKTLALGVSAHNADSLGGVRAKRSVLVKRPKKLKKR
jgi:CubicO group peptidase (beta-lactamase class C family)